MWTEVGGVVAEKTKKVHMGEVVKGPVHVDKIFAYKIL